MPVHGRPKRDPKVTKGLVLGALALLWAGGCFFDLDVPTPPANPPAPSLSVLAPQAGDTVSLTQEVSVEADSVNGIASVSVFCGKLDGGARQAYVWSAPPYQAVVDLSVCQGLTTALADAGYPSLQLSVVALTDAGVTSEQDVQVFLNANGPAISVQYAPTVQPKSPFTVTVTVTSSPAEPLGSYPVVTLAGVSADSVTQVSAAPPTYVAFFQSTKGIGTDNYTYVQGQPVPIEVLTDTDEVVRLTVDATALNGNTTAVDLSVDLSRLVWDRYIPGVPAQDSPISWAAEPVAYDGGLVLPLSTTSGGGAAAVWIPGRLSFDDGTFDGFDSSILPGGLDGGYLAVGIGAGGETLFFELSGRSANLLFAPPPGVATPPVTNNVVGLVEVDAPLTRVSGGDGGPNLLCLQDSLTACSDATVESLTCLTPELTTVRAASAVVSTGPPDAGFVTGAGGRYLSPNPAICGSSWNLVDLTNDTVSFGPLGDPNGSARDCAVGGVTRALAVGDGTFVVQLVTFCDITGIDEFPILRVGPGPANGQSTILGVYTGPLGTPQQVRQEVVGVLADGRVVTLTNSPPNTNFALWPADGGAAEVTSSIAGLYDSADALEGAVVARSTYSAADGSFAVLVSGAPLGVGVIAFGPSLQPLWLYLYPRVTTTANARLVSSASVGDVYLVDEFNNRAISLRVEPPGQLGAGPSDAGAGSADAGACTLCLTFSPETVYLAPGDNEVQLSVTSNAPEGINGNVYLAGTGPGGTLVTSLADVTFQPTTPGTQLLGPPGGYNQSFLFVGASESATPGEGQVTVTATYVDAGFELTDTASFTVAVVPVLSVTVSPASITLGPGGTQQFQATVVGPPDTDVRWQLNSGGTLNSTTANPVTFTAPATPGTYYLDVFSVAAPGFSAIATITVNGG